MQDYVQKYTWVSLDKLFLFPTYYSILIFLKFFTCYSFQATHYSFFLPIILNYIYIPQFNGGIWPEQHSHLALYTITKQ